MIDTLENHIMEVSKTMSCILTYRISQYSCETKHKFLVQYKNISGNRSWTQFTEIIILFKSLYFATKLSI
jgi:hypothetical protein